MRVTGRSCIPVELISAIKNSVKKEMRWTLLIFDGY